MTSKFIYYDLLIIALRTFVNMTYWCLTKSSNFQYRYQLSKLQRRWCFPKWLWTGEGGGVRLWVGSAFSVECTSQLLDWYIIYKINNFFKVLFIFILTCGCPNWSLIDDKNNFFIIINRLMSSAFLIYHLMPKNFLIQY